MDGHLVAVEVRIERGADERMEPDGLALDENRIKGLDAEPMERRRAVQEHRVLLDDLFEHVPHLGLFPLDHLLGALDGRREPFFFEFIEDERLEQLKRHLLREAALVKHEVRTDDDHGPAGVIHAFAEQVLTEPALLALEHVGQGFQRPLVRPAEHPSPPPVVEQRVNGLLQHPLLVTDDDGRGLELFKPAEPVVPVDHPPVEVVQVRRGEAPSLERHKRPQFRRDHRDHVEDHPVGQVARLAERLHDLETLRKLLLRGHGRGGIDLYPYLFGFGFKIYGPEHLPDRLGAHACLERARAVLYLRLPESLLGQEFLVLERGLPRVHDHKRLEIEDLLKLTERHIEDRADAARKTLQEPDVRDRGGELNMPHALAAHLGLDHFDPALVADDATVLHALVLAAQALPVLYRTEYFCTKEPVAFRLERAVVDGFRFFYLAVRPRPDALRGCDPYPDRIKIDLLRLFEEAHDIGL